MRRHPASATSETYELKIKTFENGKPEELIQMMKDFNTATDRTGTTSDNGKIQFLRTMLRGEALREFDVITSQVGSTTNGYIKLIKEVANLLSPPQRAQKTETRHEARNEKTPRSPLRNIFSTTNGIQ